MNYHNNTLALLIHSVYIANEMKTIHTQNHKNYIPQSQMPPCLRWEYMLPNSFHEYKQQLWMPVSQEFYQLHQQHTRVYPCSHGLQLQDTKSYSKCPKKQNPTKIATLISKREPYIASTFLNSIFFLKQNAQGLVQMRVLLKRKTIN